MKYNAVIFDLDGTLLDTTQGVVESAIYVAKTLGLVELPYETMLSFVGPPIQNSFKKHYCFDDVLAQKAGEIFRDYYKETALIKAVPYDGIFELCENLRKEGLKLAVATYKREDYAITLLNHFGFDRYCVSMHGADNNNVLKKSDIVNMCMTEIGGTPETSVLIGDTVHDALGAQNVGIDFIAVTYGFGFRKTDVVPYPCIGIANKPQEILNILSLQS